MASARTMPRTTLVAEPREQNDSGVSQPQRMQARFSIKLLGAELLWHRSPAPPGIELRDYLAAHAMSGYMFHVSEDSGSPLLGKVARVAYRMADEMLKARASTGPAAHPTGDSSTGDTGQRPGIQ